MKDQHDTKTDDLLKTPNARRQAAFKARMREQGYKQKQIWLHEASYESGYQAGQLGGGTVADFPPGLVDKKSWVLGYADGAILAKIWPV